ncbi:MAG: PVC-type heme-binding CxxCH protein [Sphingobacteriaceae bacterium]
MLRPILLFISFLVFNFWFGSTYFNKDNPSVFKDADLELSIKEDKAAGTISVFRPGVNTPILTQTAKADFRPYIHPIAAPDGKGVLTDFSPDHHKHQTGLYWGFTNLNGRDYFHNYSTGYWKRVSALVVAARGLEVKWQTVYDLLDEKGNTVLTETQNWSMKAHDGKFFLDLEWSGNAKTDVTIGKHPYGGLFLRMPWKEGIKGEVVNAARQRNEKAEGQPAMWVDAGMQVEGRSDLAHIAIFDHPKNAGYPQSWRVDEQMGFGPSRARNADWQIKKGETEVIRHELVVYTGELNDLDVTEMWGNYTGEKSMYSTAALWAIAQKEGRDAKFLTPQQAVEAMTIKDGFKVNVWASEPMMTQPMAFCWDDRGRLWIAENKDYESRGHGFSNAGDSRILILEDTNGDGIADTKKVFLEGIPFPSAIAVGFDGVFIGAPPNLLFVPDKNHDDKADMADIEVRLTGWGIRDRHETLNSLHWGPDGWLYGLQGFATPSKVRKPVGKGKLYKYKEAFPEDILEGEGVDINGGVWRYHPTKDRFEVVAHGFSNPWGIDYDAKGQILITACVIPHLWHVIPGGIYHRQGGQHFNPYVYDDIKTIADHSHRSAHGGASIYQSDAFPKEEQGRIFMANIHEHGILTDILERKGSGFTGHHGDDFMMANNAQWVGFSTTVGPDGGLYVLDWHDADICGQEVLNAETGRIFRISNTTTPPNNFKGRYEDLSKMSDKQLVDFQTSKSDWHSRRARLILQSRAVKGILKNNTHKQLMQLYTTNSNPDYRLRAMWALHVTKGFTEENLTAALADKDEYIRSWAIQLLCEDKTPGQQALRKFTTMAREDASPVVRLYLASAMQRIDKAAQWNIAAELVKHGEDAGDHNLPKMIWYGFEHLVAENPTKAMELVSKSNIPMITEFAARRAVDANAIAELAAALPKYPAVQLQLMHGMMNGLDGRTDLVPPANWKAVYAQLKQSGGKIAELAADLSQQFGDTEAARTSLDILKNKTATLIQKRKALQMLSGQQRPELLPIFPALLNETDLRKDVIQAIAAYEDENLGKLLLQKYPSFSVEEQAEVVQTMSSRPKYGWQLANAIKDKSIPKRDIPANTARQLRRVVGSGFVEIWGPIDETPNDKQAFAKYHSLLTDKAMGTADLKKGKVLFQRTCGSCHTLNKEGGHIGPDLTGSNRSNLDYLLFNVLNPSGEIQDAYKLVVITTRDGRTYSGNVVSENERQIKFRVVGQEPVTINKSSIQTREVTPVSMMPQGLFETLSDAEVIDLVAYLRKME